MQDALREGRARSLRVLTGRSGPTIMGDDTRPQADPAGDVGEPATADGDLDADTAPDSAPDDDPGLTDAPDGDEDAPAAPESPPSPYADDVDALADSAAADAPAAGEGA